MSSTERSQPTVTTSETDALNRGRGGEGFALVASLQSAVKTAWGTAFNHINPALQNHFVVVGGNTAEVFACVDQKIFKVRTYRSRSTGEDLFAACWLYDPASRTNHIAFAGKSRVIRVVNFDIPGSEWNSDNPDHCKDLYGHFDSINDLKTHPFNFDVFLSASGDNSTRIWNLRCNNCLVVLAGLGGHKARVMAADWHQSGEKVVSGSHDRHVKIWKLSPEMISELTTENGAPFTRRRPVYHGVVEFTTNRIHAQSVDDVLFIGDFVLSKGPGLYPALWEPLSAELGTTKVFQRYRIKLQNEYWFRLGYDWRRSIISFGNSEKGLHIFDVDSGQKIPTQGWYKSSSLIRSTALSFDGSILVGVSEDGNIFYFERGSETPSS